MAQHLYFSGILGCDSHTRRPSIADSEKAGHWNVSRSKASPIIHFPSKSRAYAVSLAMGPEITMYKAVASEISLL